MKSEEDYRLEEQEAERQQAEKACRYQIVFTVYELIAHPWFHTDPGSRLNFQPWMRKYLRFWDRVKASLLVLTGKAVAVTWPK